MRGSVVKRGKSYSVVVELDRDPLTGKRRQRWHAGYRTKKLAEDALSDMVNGIKTGTYVPKTKQTLAAFVDEWLVAIAPTVRATTHDSYERNLRRHVLPRVGQVPLQGIDGGMLNGLYAELLAGGRTDRDGHKKRGAGLSPRTVRYVHTILHRAFRDAVRWDRLARNPADRADPPRVSSSARPEMVTWTASELRTFLAAVSEDRMYAAYLVLATTGMRRGEALGLRWYDLDLDNGRAAVRQTIVTVKHQVTFGTPKTARSRRVVSLDPVTVAALREHRKRQLAEQLQIGSGWKDHGLVFCAVDGSPLHPDRFSEAFGRRAARAKVPSIRVHDLRHTWATLALSAGEHPKVVQERLGHSSIAVTLDIYSHVSEGMHRDAAARVASLFTDAG